jgi:membrane-associated phospholipid phosphatase
MRYIEQRALEFVARRFKPGQYLGLHLTIGLAISISALWVFTSLTQAILKRSLLTQFDVSLLQWLHARNTNVGLDVFFAISAFGSPLALILVGLLIAVVLARRRLWFLLSGWLAALLGAGVLDKVLKQAVGRPRPTYAYAVHTYGFGFPSGHAMASLIAYGMATYLVLTLWIERPLAQKALVLTAVGLVLSIGLSRLYLGVHYFTDELAGYAAGAFWLSACITGLEISRRRRITRSPMRP